MLAEVALVAGYIRVSTREQAEKGYSPEVQRHKITEYCERRFGEGACQLELFEDLGETGGIGLRQHPDLFRQYRPGLSDAIHFLMGGDGPVPRHFVALDQSRLERDPLLWQVLVEVYARRHGIVFHFVDEGGEMSLDDLSLMARGLTSLANASYRRQTGRRVREAAEHRARAGYHHGDPPFGWQKLSKEPGQRWAEIRPHPEQAPLVQAMKDRSLQGWGFCRIAAWLDEQSVQSPSGKRGWHPETVRAVLLNPVHAGYVRHGDQLYRGRHYDFRLWDIEVSYELERVIKQRHRSRRRGLSLSQFLLAGMLTCGHCQRAMTAWHDTTTGKRYFIAAAARYR
ncbi:MAG: recombinase family protein [Armatimonadetes bacterium]|nr:recombinase family protein [Armatimonadota bacterium]